MKPKPTEPQHHLGVKLPESKWRKLKIKAATTDKGMSVSKFIRQLIDEVLE